MPIDCQLADAATQFDGTAGKGLWVFTSFRNLPRTTRIVLTALSYHTAAAGTPGNITFFAVRAGGDPLERLILGRALSADIVGPGTEGNVTFCGRVLPRQPPSAIDGNEFWQVIAISENRDVAASVCLDFVLEPFPDTSPSDP